MGEKAASCPFSVLGGGAFPPPLGWCCSLPFWCCFLLSIVGGTALSVFVYLSNIHCFCNCTKSQCMKIKIMTLKTGEHRHPQKEERRNHHRQTEKGRKTAPPTRRRGTAAPAHREGTPFVWCCLLTSVRLVSLSLLPVPLWVALPFSFPFVWWCCPFLPSFSGLVQHVFWTRSVNCIRRSKHIDWVFFRVRESTTKEEGRQLHPPKGGQGNTTPKKKEEKQHHSQKEEGGRQHLPLPPPPPPPPPPLPPSRRRKTTPPKQRKKEGKAAPPKREEGGKHDNRGGGGGNALGNEDHKARRRGNGK